MTMCAPGLIGSGGVLERVKESRESILVPVVLLDDGAVVDPTSLTVTASVVSVGNAPGTFTPATWDENTNTDPDTYAVEVEIGPGSTIGTLERGDWWVYVKITDTPELPVLRSPTTLRIV
jgi:hypothetical protein